MDSAERPEPFAFANNFWGKDEAGIHILLGHVNNTKHTAEEIRSFYKERAAIEDDYSRRLQALARKSLGSHEIGTLKAALDTIRSNTEILAKSHANAAHQFRTELEEPLSSFSGNLRARRKTVQALTEKLTKAKLYQRHAVDRAKERFEADCNKIKGYSAQQNLLLGKELERNNHKLDKAYVSIEVTKRDYQQALRLLAEAIDRWTEEWKVSCDKLQDMEEERVNFLKSNLWAYTNIVSTVCVSDDEGCENIRVSLEKCNVDKDVEMFIRERGTGGEIMNPPEFINFMNGSRGDVQQSYRVAKFARVSANDYSQEFFDPAASMMRSSVPLARASVASCVSQATDTQTVVINKGALSTSVETGRSDTYASDPHRVSANSTVSIENGLQTIPTLHPESDYRTQSPNHLQVTSRQGSSYSSTSVSSQSDIETNERLNLAQKKQMMQNPPYIEMDKEEPIRGQEQVHTPLRGPSREPINDTFTPPTNTHDEPTPRRTWASPFRRRSKKDLTKGWNSREPVTPVTSTERTDTRIGNRFDAAENVSTPRQPYRSPFASGPATPHVKKGHSTTLSMGDSMFDLGYTLKKSPYESRGKSASPVKSLPRDDPLVMALEKLKIPPASSSTKDERDHRRNPSTQQLPEDNYEDFERNRQPTAETELVPPQPAFTEKSSGRYTDQADLFEHDKERHYQQSPTKNSNGGSSLNKPADNSHAVSPRPSTRGLQQKPRPNTMYEMDIRHQQQSEFYAGGTGGHYTKPNSIPPQTGYHRGHASNESFHQSPVRNTRTSASPYGSDRDARHSASPNSNATSPNSQVHDYRRSVSPNPNQSAFPNSYTQHQQGNYRGSASPNTGFQPPNAQYLQNRSSQQSLHRRSASPMDNNQRGGMANAMTPQQSSKQSHFNRAGSAQSSYYNQHQGLDFSGNTTAAQGYNPQYPRPKTSPNTRGNNRPPGGHGLPSVSRDGRPVLKYCRAGFDYRAAIPEEVSFRAGDILLIVRMLEDGWWEAEVLTDGHMGLAPSNFLKAI